ncbi:hypothetical protein, partial [Lactobacillus helveticus]
MMAPVGNNYDIIITIVTMGKKTLLSTISNLITNFTAGNAFILIVLDKRTTIKNVASTVAILKDGSIIFPVD